MTTKFRSACDRCHYTKVRCSGEMPCQGCLNSQSLCFYSVSSPLGRPRGTKNKTSRNRSNGNNFSDGQGIVEDGTASGEQRGLDKPSSWRRRVNKDNRNDATDNLNTVDTETQRAETLVLPTSWNQLPAEHMWFSLGEGGKEDFDFNMPDLVTPSGLRIEPFVNNSPVDSAIQMLGDTPPSRDSHSGPASDAEMSNLSALDDPMAQSTYLWKSSTCNTDKISSDFPTRPDTANLSLQNASKTASGTSTPAISAEDTYRKASPGTTCTCFLQHAELLSNPSILELNACDGIDDTVLSLDKALSLAKQGVKAWRNLIACPKCPYNNEQEVMLLAMMSIRPVTRYLQRLAPRYGASQCAASQNADAASDPWPIKPEESSRLMIGSVELDGDEKMVVCRVLFQKTVQMVRQTVHALQMLQYKRKQQLLIETSNRAAGADNYQASSSLVHIQQVSHSLATALQALESSFDSDKA